jgi:hypothetical protein
VALSGGNSHTSVVRSMNSSALTVATDGSPAAARSRAPRARSKRPLEATTMRSVTSRSTGLPGRWNVPQAHDPPAALPLTQMISPRSRNPSSCNTVVTSAESDR